MKKYLFYGMTGSKMCFMHILLNALDLTDEGFEVKIIFEGESVKLVSVLEEEKNPLYLKAKAAGLVAGICLACSKAMGVYEKNKEYGLPLLGEMSGHAGMRNYVKDGYLVVSM